ERPLTAWGHPPLETAHDATLVATVAEKADGPGPARPKTAESDVLPPSEPLMMVADPSRDGLERLKTTSVSVPSAGLKAASVVPVKRVTGGPWPVAVTLNVASVLVSEMVAACDSAKPPINKPAV